MYIDETGIDEQMYRRYVRSLHGKRVKIGISGKRQKRTGPVAAQCEGKLIAPLKYPDTMKSQLFEKWFEMDLINELAYGSVLIMDNASFYRKDVLYEIMKNPRTH